MSRLTEFYRGTGKDDRGRMLADLWRFSDERLEEVHDFIQWMFPLQEPSQFNSRAPTLTESDVAMFRADPALRANLVRSFEFYLAFLGLSYAGGQVGRGADFSEKRTVFENPNHNWLRITRVLSSTRTLGLEDASSAFFEFLKAERARGESRVAADTFRYWGAAAGEAGFSTACSTDDSDE